MWVIFFLLIIISPLNAADVSQQKMSFSQEQKRSLPDAIFTGTITELEDKINNQSDPVPPRNTICAQLWSSWKEMAHRFLFIHVKSAHSNTIEPS